MRIDRVGVTLIRNAARGRSCEAGRVEFEEYAARVLDVVDAIPPGRVMAYGDIAELVGAGGPRHVGRVMALHGATVAWWRVIRADGCGPRGHERAALERWRLERTPLRADGRRVDMTRARWTGDASDVTGDKIGDNVP